MNKVVKKKKAHSNDPKPLESHKSSKEKRRMKKRAVGIVGEAILRKVVKPTPIIVKEKDV